MNGTYGASMATGCFNGDPNTCLYLFNSNHLNAVVSLLPLDVFC